MGFGNRLALEFLDLEDPGSALLAYLDAIIHRYLSVGLGNDTSYSDPSQSTGPGGLAPSLEDSGHLQPLVQAHDH